MTKPDIIAVLDASEYYLVYDGESIHPIVSFVIYQAKDSEKANYGEVSFDALVIAPDNSLRLASSFPGTVEYHRDFNRYFIDSLDNDKLSKWLRDTAGLKEVDIRNHVIARVSERVLDNLARQYVKDKEMVSRGN